MLRIPKGAIQQNSIFLPRGYAHEKRLLRSSLREGLLHPDRLRSLFSILKQSRFSSEVVAILPRMFDNEGTKGRTVAQDFILPHVFLIQE